VFGGAGGGLWAADSGVVAVGPAPAGFGALPPPGTTIVRDGRLGGSGWFGTVGAGYDWQSANWVAGIFADGQFGDIRGTLSDPFFQNQGDEKLRTSYAAGARLGYLVAPNVLSYVNLGYSGSEWSGATLTGVFPGGIAVRTTPSFHRDGWFVGGGVENSLNIFGIAAPGWFMKTEYRSAFYSRATLPATNVFPGFVGTQTGTAVTFKPWTQTVSTSLVYRDHGFLATKYLIGSLLPLLPADDPPQPSPGVAPMTATDIVASLEAPSAKIWHLERGQQADDLVVKRWADNEQFDTRTRALWGKYRVGEEWEIKGALLGIDGTEYIPADKSDRSCQIHRFGFT
jgi:outer membrane immunogenic protein